MRILSQVGWLMSGWFDLIYNQLGRVQLNVQRRAEDLGI